MTVRRTQAGVQPRRLWGGNFSAPPSALLTRFNDSFAFDRMLLDEDALGSIAWTGALARAKAISAAEARAIRGGLKRIQARGVPSADAGAFEDVHSYVESALAARIGRIAGKLHTGRSRNDQVATDLRLYLARAFAESRKLTLDAADGLARVAIREAATVMPGYTHLRRAVPVSFGHWAHAYAVMLLRDADRFDAARARADECPLGSGALAGTSLAIDRDVLARALGFARPTANSIDAVSDRDAAAEYLFTASLLLTHLSRLAEDLILFTSDEFAFATLPDALATGSSRMPHKKNPDVLELVRGHAGRTAGDLAGLLSILKGLPLAYDKDLQLDKEPVFRTRRTLAAALPAVCALVAGLRLDRARMRAAASGDRVLSTELADAMAARGVPFREAHDVVARRLARAAAAGRTLRELGPGEGVTREDLRALDPARALARRRTIGGTAPARVASAGRATRRTIAKLRRRR
jgi:argininosuccinate lyase